MTYLYVQTLEEQRRAALIIMGKPTYSWYGSEPMQGPAYGQEIILPLNFQKIYKPANPAHRPAIYLKVLERDWNFTDGRWRTDPVNWNMSGWSFQTVADYNEENQ